MHAIKKAARREAWVTSPDSDVKTFNPFSRRLTARKARDEETGQGDGLTLSLTENNAELSQEARRRKEGRPISNGVQKAGTFPAGPNNDLPPPSRDQGDEIVSHGGTEKSEQQPPTSSDTEALKTVPTAESDYSAGPNGPRKRKSRMMFSWPSGDDKRPDVERTDTSESKRKFPKVSVMNQFKAVFASWINIMLVFVPVGIALNYALEGTTNNKVIVFVFNFLAIIPLAAMLSYATEELAMYVGETLGGLLNATFGNAVELIVSIIALVKDEVLIVQTSLVGSMLSNLLLVMGMCFFFGGLRRTEQYFNLTVAQTASSLLALAIGSLIIPTTFVEFSNSGQKGAAPASRGTAVMLLVVYASYLIFQLHTHIDMYNEPSRKSPKKPSSKKLSGAARKGLATIGAGTGAAAAGGEINQENLVREEPEGEPEVETPQLSLVGALITLAGATVLIALCAEYMVGAINAVSKTVSKEFIGLILLPIVGNAAEHATAVTVAIKDKMDLAIGVAIGSSLQIALLVLPVMVCLSWFGVGRPEVLTLSFDGFQVSVLFIAIIVVNYVIQDGKSHWLEGVMLEIIYLIIAVSAWFYDAGDAEIAG